MTSEDKKDLRMYHTSYVNILYNSIIAIALSIVVLGITLLGKYSWILISLDSILIVVIVLAFLVLIYILGKSYWGAILYKRKLEEK